MKKTTFEDVKEMALELQKYLTDNCNPYTTIIIDCDRLRFVEDTISVSINKLASSEEPANQ